MVPGRFWRWSVRDEALHHSPPHRWIATIAGLSIGLSMLSISDAEACEPAAAPFVVWHVVRRRPGGSQ